MGETKILPGWLSFTDDEFRGGARRGGDDGASGSGSGRVKEGRTVGVGRAGKGLV